MLVDDPIVPYTPEKRGSLEIAWKPRDYSKEPLRRRLIGFRSSIMAKRIPDASTQGVEFLTDIRKLEDTYGVKGTFSFAF